MAKKGTISQRIALEGGDEIKKELLELGRAGEVVWAKLNKLSKQDIAPPSRTTTALANLRKTFTEIGKAGDDLGKKFTALGKSWGEFTGSINTMVTRLGAVSLAVTGAAAGFVALTKAATDSGGAINDAAQKTGLGVEQYQVLSKFVKQAGVDAGTFETAMAFLSKQLVGFKGLEKIEGDFKSATDAAKAAKEGFGVAGVEVTRFGEKEEKAERGTLKFADAMARLKISAADIKNLNLGEVFRLISDRISALPDGMEKTALQTALLGRAAGPELTAAMNQGAKGIQEFEDRLRKLGLIVSQENIEALDALGDEADVLGDSFTVLRDKIIAAFAPDLKSLVSGALNFLAENQQKIVEFVGWLGTEAVGIVRDAYNALLGNDIAVERPWIIEWRDRLIEFGNIVRSAVYDIIIPAFTAVVTMFDSVALAINNVFGTDISGQALLIAVAVAQLTGAFGLLVSAIGLVTSALTLMTNPLGLALIGVTLLAATIALKWPEIQKGFDDFHSDKNEEKSRTFWENVGRGAGVVSKAWELLKADFAKLWEDMKQIASGAIDYIGGLITSVIEKISSAIDKLRQLISTPTPDSSPSPPIQDAYASGGYVRGRGTATSDSIPAWLSNGEFVIRAGAVKKYGRNLLAALNAGMLKLPKFAGGGPVQMTSFKLGLPKFADGGFVSATASGMSGPAINLYLPNGEMVPMVARGEDAGQVLARHASRQSVSSGGRSPRWYRG